MKRRIKTISRQITLLILFTLSITLVSIPATVLAQPPGEVNVYSFPELDSSETLTGYLSGKSEWTVTDHDLNNSNYSDEFCEIVNTLQGYGVEILPPDICLSCLLMHNTWEEILLTYAFPLIAFLRNGRLTAITIAVTDYEVLDQAIMVDIKTGVKIITSYQTYTLSDENRIRLEEALITEQGEDPDTDVFSLLPLIAMAAVVDAINPCEFYVMIVFLSTVVFRLGRKAVLKAGIAYAAAIWIIYYLMGLGLLRFITYTQEARLLIVILGFSVGLRAVLNFVFGVFGISLGLRDTIGTFLNRKFKRVPEFFSKRLSARLRRVPENPLTAFVIGVVASVILLPCTSGPYLIALSLIANLDTLLKGLLLLTVYNSIIIIPFLAITLGVYTLKVRTGELKKWSSKKQKWLNLLAGSLMIFLSLYLIFTIL